MRHLLDPFDFSVEELDDLLHLGQAIAADPAKYAHVCDGKVLATFYELSDMPPCRKCGEKPVIKGNQQSQRLECPECGMRTRQSTSGPDWNTWAEVMGGDAS